VNLYRFLSCNLYGRTLKGRQPSLDGKGPLDRDARRVAARRVRKRLRIIDAEETRIEAWDRVDRFPGD
jgi:hypothetical protein